MHVIVCIIIAIIAVVPLPATADLVVQTVPESPDPTTRYLFYLHGAGMYKGASNAVIGAYRSTVRALSKQGFVVVSEARKKGGIKKFPQDHEKYARKIAKEVKKLLDAGVPARNITVSGYSRGGIITLITSGVISNSDVNFGVMAGCISATGDYKKAVPTIQERYSPKLKGSFLSFYDTGDKHFGSCEDYFSKASDGLAYDEIALSTGMGHFTFYAPREEWLRPLTDWASNQANKN